jgi:hypothetical protein
MAWEKMLWLGILVPALAVGSAFAQPAAKPAGKGTGSAASGTTAAPAASGAARANPTGASAVGSATTATAGSPRPSASSAVDGGTYAVRLRDLEQRIDELKEQIRRSHARLALLTDTILSGGVVGSRSEIQFKNEVSSAFRLTRALFVLDGAVQYNKSDETGALAEQQQIPIFNGSIPPGDHTLQVVLELQGNGYGVFSYLKGYRFNVKSTHSFTAVEGKTLSLQVIGYEKGGVTTPLEERPAVRFEQKVTTGVAPVIKPEATPPNTKGASSLSTGVSVSAGGK